MLAVILGLCTQVLWIILTATGMGAEASPPSTLSRIGYAVVWPAVGLVGWLQARIRMEEPVATLLSYAVGTVIWGAVWFLILRGCRRSSSRGEASAAYHARAADSLIGFASSLTKEGSCLEDR